VLSHLATAESPGSAVARRQLRRFDDLFRLLRPALPRAAFHLANSAAIWNARAFRLNELTEVVRPGLSLYGVPPWPGAPARGIRPALALGAPLIEVRTVPPGESVGYGATFTVRGRAARVAIVPMGYADGLHRAASGRGLARLGGRLERFLGVVSMDLAALSCASGARPGARAWLLGPGIDPWRQAAAAGTVPYELLTSLSARVQRAYV
jgi:alanine racemase